MLLVLGCLFAVLGSAATATQTATTEALFDPFGAYSTVALIGWGRAPPDLVFPDKVVAVNGQQLRGPSLLAPPSRHIQELLENRLASGHQTATFQFDRRALADVTRTISRIAPVNFVPLLAVFLAMAACLAATGYAVIVLAADSPGGKAYVFLSIAGATFLATFLDYHTTCWLTPLFLLSFGGNVIGIGWLAWAFPNRPTESRWARYTIRALAGIVAVVSIWTVIAPVIGQDPVRARLFLSVGVGGALFLLAISVFVRLLTATDKNRAMVRSAIGGLAVVPVIIGTGSFLSVLDNARILQSLIPLGGFFIPLSVGYALIRHNALKTQEVLTRRLLKIPIAMLSVSFTVVLWVGIEGADVSGSLNWTILQLLIVLVAVYKGLHWLGERYIFQTSQLFRPTLETLSDHFARLEDPLEIVGTIVGLAEHCQSVQSAEVVRSNTSEFDPDARDTVESSAWSKDFDDERFLVPMRSLGRARGVLVVRPHAHGAVLSSEDVTLLETIASLGAVAMHHAAVIAEVNALRRLERDATERDKQSTVGVLAAELAHEIAIPLAFLRSVFRARQPGRPSTETTIDEDTIEDAQEQVERLERLSKAFRNLQPGTPQRIPVSVSAIAKKAERLLGPVTIASRIKLSFDIPEDFTVAADEDALLQVLTNLLRNAAEHSERGSEIGVRVSRNESGTDVDVWDRGPGVPDDVRESLFRPFMTTREAGTGLGLVVCARLLRLFGWHIDYVRENDETIFRIEVPATDVLGSAQSLR